MTTWGGVRGYWAGLGAQDGWLGYPVVSEGCGMSDGGCLQIFQGGALVWSPATGTHAVSGAIRSDYAGRGWQNSWLGAPVDEIVCGLRGGGCAQAYQWGSVYWAPWIGAHAVTGGIGGLWAQQGWETGGLGYPTTEIDCLTHLGGGCSQEFEGGSVYWSPGTGVHAVYGAIRGFWTAYGRESGIGYPTSDMWCDASGCNQLFERNRVHWSARTGLISYF